MTTTTATKKISNHSSFYLIIYQSLKIIIHILISVFISGAEKNEVKQERAKNSMHLRRLFEY